jgi:UDP-2,3-diacylglucosamine pyrophosphatase LpxH
VKTTVREERLLVISDVHMGNRLLQTRRPFREFVQYALDHDYSICLNGDGIDLAQMSLSRLMSDLTPSLGLFPQFGQKGATIYYTVGNHDIALEHFLTDVGQMKVVPFLNVLSGDRRIRVEHGHMYDAMFLKFPRLYFAFMMIGRFAILVGPKAYDMMHRINLAIIGTTEWILARFGAGKTEDAGEAGDALAGERECFRKGAENIGVRGFDAVLFGHTHLPGSREFEHNVKYYNTGAWFSTPYCVAIDHGRIWFGSLPELLAQDPFALPKPEPRTTIATAKLEERFSGPWATTTPAAPARLARHSRW